MPDVDVVFHDGAFWVVYHALNNWTIEVLGIGTVTDHGEQFLRVRWRRSRK